LATRGRTGKTNRESYSSKVVQICSSHSGTDRLLTMDLHAPQIRDSSSIPVDHLFAAPVLVEHFQKAESTESDCSVADAGASNGPEHSQKVECRTGDHEQTANRSKWAQVMNVIGDAKGRTCLVVDELLIQPYSRQGGGSAHQRRRNQGPCVLYASCAFRRRSSVFKARNCGSRVTIHSLHSEARKCKKISVLSVGKLLAQAVQSIHEETSVRFLFI